MTSDKKPPALMRLASYTRKYRGRVILATTFSILNKLFDIMPPLLIGAAVDIVVRREDSFLAQLGVVDIVQQLELIQVVITALAAIGSDVD